MSDRDQLRVERHAAFGEHVAIHAITAFGLFVGFGPAYERDPAVPVGFQQVDDGIAHARGIVHQHARNPGQRDCDAAHRKRAKALAEANQFSDSDVVAERPTHDQEAVDVFGPRDFVDRVALSAEAVR
jgi:hypothetical protein